MQKGEIKALLNSEEFNKEIQIFYEYLNFLEQEVLTLPGQDPNSKTLVQTAPEKIKNKNKEKIKKIKKSRMKILQMLEGLCINYINNDAEYIQLRCWKKELNEIIEYFFDNTTSKVNLVANRQGFKNKILELKGLELLISRIHKLTENKEVST
jgi:hypothetical protein